MTNRATGLFLEWFRVSDESFLGEHQLIGWSDEQAKSALKLDSHFDLSAGAFPLQPEFAKGLLSTLGVTGPREECEFFLIKMMLGSMP